MSDIKVDGQPLAAALATQQTEEITQVYQQELASRSKAVAHRKPRSNRVVRCYGGGRPKSGHSLITLDKIILLLRDESLTVPRIAEHMNMKVGEVERYQRIAREELQKGRKPAR